MGLHSCDLCDRDPVHDKRELAVPAGAVLYVAPAMIGHYIDTHGYRPPDEFIRAVESGPRRGSLRHRLAMLRHFRHGFSWYFV